MEKLYLSTDDLILINAALTQVMRALLIPQDKLDPATHIALQASASILDQNKLNLIPLAEKLNAHIGHRMQR